jgi:hypothetical protein
MPGGEAHEAGSPLVQQDLDQVFKAFNRRQYRLRDIAFDNSSHRMKLRHRLDNLEHHLVRLQNSLGLLVQPTNLDLSPKKPRTRRKKLQTTVILDVEALVGQIQALNFISEEFRESDRKQDGT